MKELVAELSELIKEMPAGYQRELDFGKLDARNDGVYPFSKLEKAFIYLLDSGVINLGKYLDIRKRYCERNKFLEAFQINSAKYFNQWIREYLKHEEPELIDASTEFDEEYSPYHYQLLLDSKIRICVKASRAVDRYLHVPLAEKALAFNDRVSDFRIQFQTFYFQKEKVDVYLLLAIWKDRIVNYVMTESEITSHPGWLAFKRSNAGGDGQLRIIQGSPYQINFFFDKKSLKEKNDCTRDDFDQFIVPNNHLVDAIRHKMRLIEEGKLK